MTADPWQQLCTCGHTLVDHNLGVVPSGPRDCAHEDCDCVQFVAATRGVPTTDDDWRTIALAMAGEGDPSAGRRAMERIRGRHDAALAEIQTILDEADHTAATCGRSKVWDARVEVAVALAQQLDPEGDDWSHLRAAASEESR